jgi:predicted SprT family Zn-dependent metalloprotease
MIVPPVKERRLINRLLVAFFEEHKLPNFNRAIAEICRFYRLKRPRVEWFEYLDWGRTAGRTYDDGKIHLVHPENWKKGRKYNSEKQWVNTVYHEMGHYIFWSDAERKADTFAARMERNVSRNGNGAAHARTRVARRAA